MADPLTITRDDDAGRFETVIDGVRGELTFRRVDDRLVLVHTGVPDAIAGHGVAGQLAEAAIGFAAEQGLTVVPQCPYVRSWLAKHPEQAATVAIAPLD